MGIMKETILTVTNEADFSFACLQAYDLCTGYDNDLVNLVAKYGNFKYPYNIGICTPLNQVCLYKDKTLYVNIDFNDGKIIEITFTDGQVDEFMKYPDILTWIKTKSEIDFKLAELVAKRYTPESRR